jgi:hypothetical protein
MDMNNSTAVTTTTTTTTTTTSNNNNKFRGEVFENFTSFVTFNESNASFLIVYSTAYCLSVPRLLMTFLVQYSEKAMSAQYISLTHKL